MLFHGKALEIYTAAYQAIQNIDENEDLEVRAQLNLHVENYNSSNVFIRKYMSYLIPGGGVVPDVNLIITLP